MSDTQVFSRYSAWLPSTPVLANSNTNPVPQNIVKCNAFPLVLLAGSIFLSHGEFDPPVYSSPPNYAPIVIPGYQQPHMWGQVIQTRPPLDSPTVGGATKILNGVTNPHLWGQVIQTRTPFWNGPDVVLAQRPNVILAPNPPHMWGSVVYANRTNDTASIDKVPVGVTQSYGVPLFPSPSQGFFWQSFTKDLGVQPTALPSKPIVVQSEFPRWRQDAGFVWQTNLGGRQDPLANQQKLSAPLVSVAAPSGVLYGAGSFILTGKGVFPEWDRAVPSPLVNIGSRAPLFGGSVTFIKVFSVTDKASQSNILLAPNIIPQGFVYQSRAPISTEKSSTTLYVKDYGTSLNLNGFTFISKRILDIPSVVIPVIALPSGVANYSTYTLINYGGFVMMTKSPMLNYGSVPSDYKWFTSPAMSGWSFLLSSGWTFGTAQTTYSFSASFL